MKTPSKKNQVSRSQISDVSKMSENCDPNVTGQSSLQKSVPSPANRSAKTKKSSAKIPSSIFSPPKIIRERKFVVVAKKKSFSANKDLDQAKCRQSAYEALRASQENFFCSDHGTKISSIEDAKNLKEEDEEQKKKTVKDKGSLVFDLEGSSKIRKLRSLMMEEAMSCLPETGEGRVLHLVKAFENMVSISKYEEPNNEEEGEGTIVRLPLPGLHPPKDRESSSSVGFLFPPNDLDRESKVCASFGSCDGRSVPV